MASTKYPIQEGPGRYDFERGIMDGAFVSFTFFGVPHWFEIRLVECVDSRRDGWWALKGHKITLTGRVLCDFTARYNLRKRKGEIETDLFAGR